MSEPIGPADVVVCVDNTGIAAIGRPVADFLTLGRSYVVASVSDEPPAGVCFRCGIKHAYVFLDAAFGWCPGRFRPRRALWIEDLERRADEPAGQPVEDEELFEPAAGGMK